MDAIPIVGNFSMALLRNITSVLQDTIMTASAKKNHHHEPNDTEKKVAIIVPTIFGIIVFLGLLGNLLVMIVIITNKQMRSTTNLLIFNLAIADLLFIIICVPFTATYYAYPTWPFGNFFCKIYQFMVHVTAYASIYTLVVMSLDRYLAVVHPVDSLPYRTIRNTLITIIILWIVIMICNIPLLIDSEKIDYLYHGQVRSTCQNGKILRDPDNGKIFYGCFFAFCFILPLATIIILYSFMLRRLLCDRRRATHHEKINRKVTKMVVSVVLVFALCWLPLHIILMIQYFDKNPKSNVFLFIQIASNCLAYMNSCVNPFLYAFLSENFRKRFHYLLCCKRSNDANGHLNETRALTVRPSNTESKQNSQV